MDKNLFKLVLACLLAALIAASAAASIPTTPPVTLTVLFVLLSGALLGPLWGLASTSIYLLLGSLGLPVFANLASGFNYILNAPSGGFLVGYAFAAIVAGLLSDRKGWNFWRNLLACVAGIVALYAVGLPRLAQALSATQKTDVTVWAALGMMWIHLGFDLAKAVLVAWLLRALKPVLADYLPAKK